MNFIVKLQIKIDVLRRIIKYIKNPWKCVLAYVVHKNQRIKFRWGFSGNLPWDSMRFALIVADKGWYLCDCNENFLMFTDGKLKFMATNYSKMGIIAQKPDLYQCFDYKNATVLDIGAFSGDSLILFFKWGAKRVTAYEPVPENVKLIKLNVKINKLENKVTIMPYAVSDRNGYVKFSYNQFDQAFGLRPGKYKIELPCVSIREIVNKAKDVNIAKVDCEGCERYLLKVDNLRIPNWIIEVHDFNLSVLLINHFKNKGYEVLARPYGDVFTRERALVYLFCSKT